MAIDFPNAPAVNDTYTVGNITWKYNGTSWIIVSASQTVTVNLSSATPLMNGSASAGVGTLASRDDHVHPTDTALAPLASPALTGTPTAPTAAVDTNTTQLATTAYVIGQGYLKSATASSTYLTQTTASTTYAPLASPTFTGTVTSPTFSTTIADTVTAASHYFVETASDGIIRPKTLANVKAEILATPTLTGTVTASALTTAGLVTTTSGGVLSSSSYPRANADMMGFTSTATAGTTTTLSNTSTQYQLFTGSANQTVTLPVTSTLVQGWTFHIVNNSTGTITVNSSGGNLVVSVPPNMTSMVTAIGTTLTTAADWEAGYTDFGTITGTGSAVLSNSPTFTGAVLGVEDTIPYSKTGTLAISTGTIRYRFPWAATILGVTAAVNTAPVGASIIADVKKNGTTIFTTTGNRPTIAAGTNATTTEPTPDVTTIAAGDYITVDIAQVGSTTAGSDLTVIVRYKRA